MTVKELIIKLLEEDMNAVVQLSIDEPHHDKHGECKGYVFDINSVSHEFGGCMIKFTDWREKNKRTCSSKKTKKKDNDDYPFDPNVIEMGQL